HNANGLALGQAGILLILCLIFAALAGITYLLRQLLPLSAAAGAGVGTFAFFFFIASIILVGKYHGSAKIGIILRLIAAIFISGAFVTLSVFRPLEIPVTQSMSAPLLKRHGGLLLAVASGVVLGFVYLVLTALA